MAERGQRTRLRFGDVTAEVSLVNATQKPKAAQHETKRVLVEPKTDPIPADVAERQSGVYAEGLRTGDLHGAATAAGYPVDPLEDAPLDAAREDVSIDPLGPTDQPEPAMSRAEHFDPPAARTPEEEAAYIARDVDAQAAEQAPVSLPTQSTEPTPITAPGLFTGTADTASGPHDPAADIRAGAVTVDELAQSPAVEERAIVKQVEEYVPPPTTVQQGVHTPEGEWIDLTARFEEVDERTKVDGLEVVQTFGVNAIPRERVRGAHYIAGVNPGEYDVLALLWRGLREANACAAARWTKRTAQTLGVIVARGELESKVNPARLLLLEVEWAENMRAPGPRVSGPIKRPQTSTAIGAAVELVKAFEAPAAQFDALRDERLAKRAELLELARAGELETFVPPPPRPPEPVEDVPDLAAALAASVTWVRERATA